MILYIYILDLKLTLIQMFQAHLAGAFSGHAINKIFNMHEIKYTSINDSIKFMIISNISTLNSDLDQNLKI